MFKKLIHKIQTPVDLKLKISLFFISLLLIKLFFFFKLHFVLFCGDSSSYVYNTYCLIDGVPLNFDSRPPGYSFFMFFVWKILAQDYFNIVIAQIIVSVFSWTVLFFMFTKFFSKTGFIFFFLALLNSLPFFWFEDYIIYSESLSLSLFIFSVSFFGLAIHSKKSFYALLCSLSITFSILTKSSLIPLIFLLVILLIVNYNSFRIWNNVSMLFLPLIFLLALNSFYNYKTLGTFSLFKFGDFVRMTSVNFIIDQSFTDDKGIKKDLTYYSNKISLADHETINNINSAFETSAKIRETYSNNNDNIYFYYNYLTDSLKMSPMQIYSSVKDYVSKGRKKDGKLYFNFIVNNFVSCIYNTKQGERYPVNTINKTHKIENLKADLVGKEYIKKIEFANFFTSVGFHKRALPAFLLKLLFKLNQVFRNMFWFIIFLFAFVINLVLLKRSKLKDAYSVFNFAIFCFALACVFFIVTTGSANIDRYSLFSDLVIYLSFIFLCYAINKLFHNQIKGFKNKYLQQKISSE